MSNHAWSKFWWQDWQTDAGLRMCSLEARGLWMEMLCIMAASPKKGYLLIGGKPPTIPELARVVGIHWRACARLAAILEAHKVYSRDGGLIFCRRMVRDAKNEETGREGANKRWKAKNKAGGPQSAPPNGQGTGHPTSEANSPEAEAEADLRASRSERARSPARTREHAHTHTREGQPNFRSGAFQLLWEELHANQQRSADDTTVDHRAIRSERRKLDA